jgi:hypothetical protein
MYTEEHLSEKSDFRALSEFALPLSFIWATIHHYIFFYRAFPRLLRAATEQMILGAKQCEGPFWSFLCRR